MKFSPLRWFVAALALAIAVVFVRNLPSTDKPPPVEKKSPPRAATPAGNSILDGLGESLRRRTEAERFVRPFQSSFSGVDLAKELKVTDEQATKLDGIMSRVREQTGIVLRAQLPALENRQDREAQRAEMIKQNEAMTNVYERAWLEISAVLSAEQIGRAEQIELQSRLRTSGMARILASDNGFQSLNLTPDQAARLQAAQTTAQQEFEKDYDALRAQQRQKLLEARKKVLSVLTPEQQAQYEKLTGTPIEIDDRTLDYGVAGVSARMNRELGRGGFGRGFRGAGGAGAFGQAPGNAPPAAPAPAAPPGPAPAPSDSKP